MPYRLRYDCFVDFVPPGVGLGQQGFAPGAVGAGPAGQQQTLQFFNSITSTLPPASNTFVGADVTALTNAMAADIAAQLNANLGRIQGFATGGG